MDTVSVLILFVLIWHSATDWVDYKHQTFLSHRSGGWTSQNRVPMWLGESPLCIPVVEEASQIWGLFYFLLIYFLNLFDYVPS